jgi:TolB-like protein/DNA-binding SARP family transcriptional activator/Tfp pilus assembly protein PilF
LGKENEGQACWSLRLFGGFELSSLPGGERVASLGKRERVLLACLALSPNCRQQRRKLATLLWGDATDETLLDNLRNCLWGLRRALGDTKHRVVASDGEEIVLDTSAFEVDALAFRRLAAQSSPRELEAAANLYAGELLDGFTIESAEFETWRRVEATRVRDEAIEVLTRLMAQSGDAGESERAIKAGHRVLELDPLHEAAVRRLMRLYAESGRRGAAVQLYRALAETLRAELNAQPEAETRAVFSETSRGGEETSVLPAGRARIDRPKDMAVAAVVSATAGPREPQSIAVLPFVNMSGDAGQEFFSDGMTEEITAALAKVPDLRVVGRTSAFQFKGQNQDLRSIGQALGATHLIEGSVRKAGDRVRITAQLIKAQDGTHLWGEKYDRNLTDIFAVQEDIAQAITASLPVPLGLPQGGTLVRNRTQDLESYQEYLRARALYRSRRPNEAKTILDVVVARDPAFAPAWALSARNLSTVPNYSSATRSGTIGEARQLVLSSYGDSERAARRAIELDPQHAAGYSALGTVELLRGHFAAAEDLIRNALILDANDPDGLMFYGQLLGTVGRLNDALHVMEQLKSLEPFVPVYNIVMVEVMQAAGQTAATIPILEAMPHHPPTSLLRNTALAEAYAAARRYNEAADTLLAIQGTLVSRKSVEEAARLIRHATGKAAPRALPVLQGELNFVYAHLGALDRILDFPERNLKIGIGSIINANHQLWPPERAGVRKTERFKAYVRNAGFVDYWRERGWPDLCRPVGTDDFVCK